jgi:hypothetical protein
MSSYEHGRRFTMLPNTREWITVAAVAGTILLLLTFPYPAEVVGIGEWGRLVVLLMSAGLVSLSALFTGWLKVYRRLRNVQLTGRLVDKIEAQTVANEARENQWRVAELVADLAKAPILLLALSVVLAMWANVWWMGMGRE